VLVALVAVAMRRPGSFAAPPQFIVLPPPAAGDRLLLPPYGGRRIPAHSGEHRGPGGGRTVPSRPARALPPPSPVPAVSPSERAPAAAPAGVSRGVFGIVTPGLGQAKLWVEPLPLPPRELAAALSSGNARLVDSAITMIVQHYLDSIAVAPDRPRGPPDWTTTVAGTKFGLDAKNIYVAGLKIPTAVLALLKLPGANESRVFERGIATMQEDLHRAAQRAVTLDEFRQSVRELRAERQRQHDLEVNAKLSPADTAAQRKDGGP
jgi:hypothetical protein